METDLRRIRLSPTVTIIERFEVVTGRVLYTIKLEWVEDFFEQNNS